MKKETIIKRIKEKIILNEKDWADAYIAGEFNASTDTPEAKKQIASAKHAMNEIQTRIDFLKKLLKDETSR